MVGGTSDSEFAIARFNANGTVDTTFGDLSGATLTNFGGFNSLNDIAVNSLNQIVAVGNVYGGSPGISASAVGSTATLPSPVLSGQQDAILAV